MVGPWPKKKASSYIILSLFWSFLTSLRPPLCSLYILSDPTMPVQYRPYISLVSQRFVIHSGCLPSKRGGNRIMSSIPPLRSSVYSRIQNFGGEAITQDNIEKMGKNTCRGRQTGE
ncbi:hypothetical protein DFS34DRAFT_30341 [Phlyctochytrium arcticum]|nr:hypothetical protein DFS34DRAFT_30341 [Phlyctochytrium arcticum]